MYKAGSVAVRVGFASAVRHAVPYLELLTADERVSVVGVGEAASVEQWMQHDSARAAESVGVPFHSNLDEWLNPHDIDLAVVCSEPTRHADLAIEMMERGIDVLVDKPVAVTVHEADRIRSVAHATGRRCFVINRTHAPALRRLRSWIDQGLVGLPRHLDMEFFASGAFFSTSVERPELVVDPSISGGGEILNFLGYCADAIRYASGLEVESVYALAGNLFSQSHADHGVEDSAVLSLGLQHGVTATITLGRVPYAPGFGPTSSSMRVLGSHAHAVADDDQPALLRFGGDSGVDVSSFDGGIEALRAYVDHVVARAVDGQQPDYDIDDARASIAVIDAAYRSVASGQPERPL